MTHAHTRYSTDGPTPPLARLRGVELPVPGTWTVAGSHARIAFDWPRRPGRTDTWQGRAIGATVAVGPSVRDIAVAVLLDVPGRSTIVGGGGPAAGPARLEAATATNRQPSALSGELSVDGCVYPVHATLTFHGVWRRADGAYGWFGLSGAIDHGGRAKWWTRFCVDLIAEEPELVDL